MNLSISNLISVGLESILLSAPRSHGQQQLLYVVENCIFRNWVIIILIYTVKVWSVHTQLGEFNEVGSFQILPLDIPLDRVFDVQWNPPGYPELGKIPLFSPRLMTTGQHVMATTPLHRRIRTEWWASSGKRPMGQCAWCSKRSISVLFQTRYSWWRVIDPGSRE